MRWSCRYRGETVPFPISHVLHILKYEYFNTAKFVNIFHLCTVLLPLSQQDKKHKSRLISSYCFTIPAKISRAKKRQKKKKINYREISIKKHFSWHTIMENLWKCLTFLRNKTYYWPEDKGKLTNISKWFHEKIMLRWSEIIYFHLFW